MACDEQDLSIGQLSSTPNPPSATLLEKQMLERQRFFDLMREGAAGANLDEDEAMQLALEAQQTVRTVTRVN